MTCLLSPRLLGARKTTESLLSNTSMIRPYFRFVKFLHIKKPPSWRFFYLLGLSNRAQGFNSVTGAGTEPYGSCLATHRMVLWLGVVVQNQPVHTYPVPNGTGVDDFRFGLFKFRIITLAQSKVRPLTPLF